jgi:hypothetical protein
MIRLLFRTLGFVLLCMAFLFCVYDGTRSIADSTLMYTKMGEAWGLLDAASLARLQLLVGQQDQTVAGRVVQLLARKIHQPEKFAATVA